MTELCGIYSPGNQSDLEPLGRRMMAAVTAPHVDSPLNLRAPVALGASQGAVPSHLVESGPVVAAWIGHARLMTERGYGAEPSAIVDALRDLGTAALASIEGDFVLAAWNGQTRRGILAIDRIGIRQLAYAKVDDGLAFASHIDSLLAHPAVARELSPQALYDYLYFHVCPGSQTVYRDIARLPPGHYLEFGPGVEAQPQPYWTMRFEEDRKLPFSVLKEQFVAVLRQTVHTAADGVSCGAFLSGGTDSSTVSGMLGQALAQPAKTFSIGFDAPGYDEMDYARIAARHFGFKHHEYYVTPGDVVAAAPRIAAQYDQPFGNASAIPAYYCAQLAREHGVQRLLAGDGGDELFGGNERYAKQHVLGLYDRLPAALRAALVEPLVLSTPLFRALPGLRKVHSYVRQAATPMPQRYDGHNLLTHLQPSNVLSPEFLAAIDPRHPLELMREVHAPHAHCSLINQMLGIDLRFTLADNDLPKVTRTCELAGVDVAFPLLDERVVAFSAQLAPELKLRGMQLRWFFKEALRDFLPPEIIAKRKHGFGLPVGLWLTQHRPLLDLAGAAIESLRPLGILRAGFVDELRQRLLPQHPAYYGTMVWVLMMLGLWFDTRRPR